MDDNETTSIAKGLGQGGQDDDEKKKKKTSFSGDSLQPPNPTGVEETKEASETPQEEKKGIFQSVKDKISNVVDNIDEWAKKPIETEAYKEQHPEEYAEPENKEAEKIPEVPPEFSKETPQNGTPTGEEDAQKVEPEIGETNKKEDETENNVEETDRSSDYQQQAQEQKQISQEQMQAEMDRHLKQARAEKRHMAMGNAARAIAPALVQAGLQGYVQYLGSVRTLTNAFLSGQLLSDPSRVLAEAMNAADTTGRLMKRAGKDYGIMQNADMDKIKNTAKGRMMMARNKAEAEGVAYANVELGHAMDGKDVTQLDLDDVQNVYNVCAKGVQDAQNVLKNPNMPKSERMRAAGRLAQYRDVIQGLDKRNKELGTEFRQMAADQRAADKEARDAKKRQAEQDLQDKFDGGNEAQKWVWTNMFGGKANVDLDENGVPTDGRSLNTYINKLDNLIGNKKAQYADTDDPNSYENDAEWQQLNSIREAMLNRQNAANAERDSRKPLYQTQQEQEERYNNGNPVQQWVWDTFGKQFDIDENGVPKNPRTITSWINEVDRRMMDMEVNGQTSDPEYAKMEQFINNARETRRALEERKLAQKLIEKMQADGTYGAYVSRNKEISERAKTISDLMDEYGVDASMSLQDYIDAGDDEGAANFRDMLSDDRYIEAYNRIAINENANYYDRISKLMGLRNRNLGIPDERARQILAHLKDLQLREKADRLAPGASFDSTENSRFRAYAQFYSDILDGKTSRAANRITDKIERRKIQLDKEAAANGREVDYESDPIYNALQENLAALQMTDPGDDPRLALEARDRALAEAGEKIDGLNSQNRRVKAEKEREKRKAEADAEKEKERKLKERDKAKAKFQEDAEKAARGDMSEKQYKEFLRLLDKIPNNVANSNRVYRVRTAAMIGNDWRVADQLMNNLKNYLDPQDYDAMKSIFEGQRERITQAYMNKNGRMQPSNTDLDEFKRTVECIKTLVGNRANRDLRNRTYRDIQKMNDQGVPDNDPERLAKQALLDYLSGRTSILHYDSNPAGAQARIDNLVADVKTTMENALKEAGNSTAAQSTSTARNAAMYRSMKEINDILEAAGIDRLTLEEGSFNDLFKRADKDPTLAAALKRGDAIRAVNRWVNNRNAQTFDSLKKKLNSDRINYSVDDITNIEGMMTEAYNKDARDREGNDVYINPNSGFGEFSQDLGDILHGRIDSIHDRLDIELRKTPKEKLSENQRKRILLMDELKGAVEDPALTPDNIHDKAQHIRDLRAGIQELDRAERGKKEAKTKNTKSNEKKAPAPTPVQLQTAQAKTDSNKVDNKEAWRSTGYAKDFLSNNPYAQIFVNKEDKPYVESVVRNMGQKIKTPQSLSSAYDKAWNKLNQYKGLMNSPQESDSKYAKIQDTIHKNLITMEYLRNMANEGKIAMDSDEVERINNLQDIAIGVKEDPEVVKAREEKARQEEQARIAAEAEAKAKAEAANPNPTPTPIPGGKKKEEEQEQEQVDEATKMEAAVRSSRKLVGLARAVKIIKPSSRLQETITEKAYKALLNNSPYTDLFYTQTTDKDGNKVYTLRNEEDFKKIKGDVQKRMNDRSGKTQTNPGPTPVPAGGILLPGFMSKAQYDNFVKKYPKVKEHYELSADGESYLRRKDAPLKTPMTPPQPTETEVPPVEEEEDPGMTHVETPLETLEEPHEETFDEDEDEEGYRKNRASLNMDKFIKESTRNNKEHISESLNDFMSHWAPVGENESVANVHKAVLDAITTEDPQSIYSPPGADGSAMQGYKEDIRDLQKEMLNILDNAEYCKENVGNIEGDDAKKIMRQLETYAVKRYNEAHGTELTKDDAKKQGELKKMVGNLSTGDLLTATVHIAYLKNKSKGLARKEYLKAVMNNMNAGAAGETGKKTDKPIKPKPEPVSPEVPSEEKLQETPVETPQETVDPEIDPKTGLKIPKKKPGSTDGNGVFQDLNEKGKPIGKTFSFRGSKEYNGRKVAFDLDDKGFRKDFEDRMKKAGMYDLTLDDFIERYCPKDDEGDEAENNDLNVLTGAIMTNNPIEHITAPDIMKNMSVERINEENKALGRVQDEILGNYVDIYNVIYDYDNTPDSIDDHDTDEWIQNAVARKNGYDNSSRMPKEAMVSAIKGLSDRDQLLMAVLLTHDLKENSKKGADPTVMRFLNAIESSCNGRGTRTPLKE